MSKVDGHRRTTTLSVSLTTELSEAISARVRSGLYTSASELVREALRLLLKVEEVQHVMVRSGARETGELARSALAQRFAITGQLLDLGVALRQGKLGGGSGGEAGARERLAELEERLEAGPGLRIAPERLEKLKLRE